MTKSQTFVCRQFTLFMGRKGQARSRWSFISILEDGVRVKTYELDASGRLRTEMARRKRRSLSQALAELSMPVEQDSSSFFGPEMAQDAVLETDPFWDSLSCFGQPTDDLRLDIFEMNFRSETDSNDP